MNISEKILAGISKLPESKQIEVLDFVEYLEQRTQKDSNKTWANLSISSAMRGMESEQSPYSTSDCTEKF